MLHGLDNEKQVFFYEHEFYVLSNFSSFALEWKGRVWPTSEHAYQAEKFTDKETKDLIYQCRSAHDAFKLAIARQADCQPGWNEMKLGVMKEILRAKVAQHPYVRKKLLETGERELVEDSWRDPFWGWGENRDGQNHLGRLWMEVRAEVVAE